MITDNFKVLTVPSETDGRFDAQFKDEVKQLWIPPEGKYNIVGQDGLRKIDQVMKVGNTYRAYMRPDGRSIMHLQLVDEADNEDEWNGDGLPPIGEHCLFRLPLNDYRECEIRAVTDEFIVYYSFEHKKEFPSIHGDVEFKPLPPVKSFAHELWEEISQDTEISAIELTDTEMLMIGEAIEKAGYHKQEKDNKPEWISVDDALPVDVDESGNQTVWVTTEHGHVGYAVKFKNLETGVRYFADADGDYIEDIHGDVTHWMPCFVPEKAQR